MNGSTDLRARAALHQARSRHPASRAGRPAPISLAARIMARLARSGVAAPEVGAATLAARGCWALDRNRFAAILRIDPRLLIAIESGAVPIDDVPGVLSASEPFRSLSNSLCLHRAADEAMAQPMKPPACGYGPKIVHEVEKL